MRLSARVAGSSFSFASIKEVLAKANEPRSGDAQAGLAATSLRELAAARQVLAELTLADLRRSPSVPLEECELSRLFEESLDEKAYRVLAQLAVGELREWLLDDATSGEAILAASPGLTPEMIAAAAKLMSNLDLIVAAKKIPVVARCNSTIGLPGRLSSRLQPNDPRDDLGHILAAVREGLAYGTGDAVIGINPATESVEATAAVLAGVKDFMRRWEVPTQNCVLAHVRTQMRAMERGAPVDLLFQSLAGSEKANRNFGISIALLDEAWEMVQRVGTAQGPNRMYFETGQGTALSANAHYGADQVTMEARAYGLARRYRPFLVNSVVGFIGPEYLADGKQITRAALEDHFIGKLSGLPMGCDACYTNHAAADQNDLENLEVLLASAGVTYLMSIPAGDDVMLNYQTTSFHDNATLRALFGLRPTPEFEAWLERMGLWRDGRLTARAGDASVFAEGGRP